MCNTLVIANRSYSLDEIEVKSLKAILSYFLIIWLIISYIARIVPSIRPVLGHVPVHKQELSGKMV